MEEWKPEPEPEITAKNFVSQPQLSYEAQVKHETILTEPVLSSNPSFVFPEKNVWKPEIEFRPEAYPRKFQEEWSPPMDLAAAAAAAAVVLEEEEEEEDDDLPEMEELKPGKNLLIVLLQSCARK